MVTGLACDVLATIRMRAVALVSSLWWVACDASVETAVEVQVEYDDAWGLTAFTGTIGDKPLALAPTHSMYLLIPDRWVGTDVPLELIGVNDGEELAKGTATLRPIRDRVVTDSMGLSLLSCENPCTWGQTTCRDGGVATCERGADSCLDWSVPIACAAETPVCAAGGCIASPGTVRPSNSDVIGELEDTGRIVDVPAGSTFDTNSDCTTGAIVGRCVPVQQDPLPEICVCRAESVTIHGLTVQGPRSLAILAWRSVTVTGDLIVRPGTGSRVGTGGSEGASYGTRGGASMVAPVGDASLVPLAGGFAAGGANGGVGGGGLQITANDEIRIDGVIAAGGGGGTRRGCIDDTARGAGGGGSGGSILLEATAVVGTGAVVAHGGGGSSGYLRRYSSGSDYYFCGAVGGDGGTDPTLPATGGAGSSACSATRFGGRGGDGSTGDGDGAVGTAGQGGSCAGSVYSYLASSGGGGGGAGRIRLNTASGACASCVGATSPTPTYGTTRYLP